MNCDKKDISKWNNTKKLREASKAADLKRKSDPLIIPKQTKDDEKIIRVVKKDGTVRFVKM
jgi:hypothetical protein